MTADSYEKKVETVARAICDARLWVGAWEQCCEPTRENFRVEARAALAALAIHPETADAGAGELVALQEDSNIWARRCKEQMGRLAEAERQLAEERAKHALTIQHYSVGAAPAPAISGGERVSVPRDDLQTLIEQADAMAFERSAQDYEQFGRPQYIENAYRWLLAAAGQKP